MIKKIIIFLLFANILYSHWNRKCFVIFDKNKKEICKKIKLWSTYAQRCKKYVLIYDIYFNDSYIILIREIELYGLALFTKKYKILLEDIFKFKFLKFFKDIKELNNVNKLEKAFGYLEIKGPNLHNFYVYFSSPLTTGIKSTNCGKIEYDIGLFKNLKARDYYKLQELLDIISSQPLYLNFDVKRNKVKYYMKESFFECGLPEEEFGFDCSQIGNKKIEK